MSVSHKMDLVIRHEDRRIVSQMLIILDAECERLEKMVKDNSDSTDEIMPYILFAWEKYADSIKETANYFRSMQERDK